MMLKKEEEEEAENDDVAKTVEEREGKDDVDKVLLKMIISERAFDYLTTEFHPKREIFLWSTCMTGFWN